jgi:CheY-like chemotaxis protein
MNGTLEVSSAPGAGSVFTLVLAHDPGVPDPTRPAPQTLALTSAVPPLHMVYVEDDPVNRMLMESAMAFCPQVTLHMAVSCAEGLQLIDRVKPRVVLLDINLPDHIDTAMRAGFDHHLAKPVSFDELFSWLGRVERPSHQQAIRARQSP